MAVGFAVGIPMSAIGVIIVGFIVFYFLECSIINLCACFIGYTICGYEEY